MRYVSLAEVVDLHRRLLQLAGGASGIRDLGALESAVAQPKATFEGVDLHSTLVEKAAAMGFALVRNHPFVDANKRVGHAAMETFLALNGFEIEASTDLSPDRCRPADSAFEAAGNLGPDAGRERGLAFAPGGSRPYA
jgi:death-on-curing protein